MLDWRNIDTVLLDMDGTLLDLHFDNYFWLQHLPKRYAEIYNSEEDRVRNELITRFQLERGSLNWYCIDYWSRELQLDIRELKEEVKHLIKVRPYVEEFLQNLHDRGCHVLLVTNAHQDSLKLKLSNTGLERWFDAIICAHDLQKPKEHEAFWDALQEIEPFNPTRTLLIDDTVSVLESAQRYGIQYLLTLLQPDSQSEIRTNPEYPAIHHFDEIMPQ